jgi:hypothetical protein
LNDKKKNEKRTKGNNHLKKKELQKKTTNDGDIWRVV